MPDEKQVSFADSHPGDVAQIMQTINSQELYNLFEYNKLRSNEKKTVNNQIDLLGVNVMEHALELIKNRYTGFDYFSITKSGEKSLGNWIDDFSTKGHILRNLYDWNRKDSFGFSNRQFPDAIFKITITLKNASKTFLICHESDGDSKENRSRIVAMKMWQDTDLCRLVNEHVPAFTVRTNLTRWRTDVKAKREDYYKRGHSFQIKDQELERYYNDIYSIEGNKWSDLPGQVKKEFREYHHVINQLNLSKDIIHGFLTNLCRSLVAVAWDLCRVAVNREPRILQTIQGNYDMHIFVGSFKFDKFENDVDSIKRIQNEDWFGYKSDIDKLPKNTMDRFPRQTKNRNYPDNQSISCTLNADDHGNETNVECSLYRCKNLFRDGAELLPQWQNWGWKYRYQKIPGENVMPDTNLSAVDVQMICIERLNYINQNEFSGMWYVSDLKTLLAHHSESQKIDIITDLCNLNNLLNQDKQHFNFNQIKHPFGDNVILPPSSYEERYNQPWYRMFVEPFMNMMENQFFTFTNNLKWVQLNRRELNMIETFKVIKDPRYYFSVRREDLNNDIDVVIDNMRNVSLTRICLNSLSETLPSDGPNAQELKVYLHQFHVPHAFTFFRMMGCTNVLSLQEMARRCFSETEFRARLNRKLDMLPLGMQTEVLFVLSYCREHIFLPRPDPKKFEDFLEKRAEEGGVEDRPGDENEGERGNEDGRGNASENGDDEKNQDGRENEDEDEFSNEEKSEQEESEQESTDEKKSNDEEFSDVEEVTSEDDDQTMEKKLQATQGYEIVSESMLKTMSQYDDGKSENLTYELAMNLLEKGHHIWIWMSLKDAEGNPRKKWKLPFEEWICMHIHKYKAGEPTPDSGFVDLKISARGRNKYPVKLVWEQYYTGPGNGWWALEKTTTVKVS